MHFSANELKEDEEQAKIIHRPVFETRKNYEFSGLYSTLSCCLLCLVVCGGQVEVFDHVRWIWEQSGVGPHCAIIVKFEMLVMHLVYSARHEYFPYEIHASTTLTLIILHLTWENIMKKTLAAKNANTNQHTPLVHSDSSLGFSPFVIFLKLSYPI